MHHYTDGGLKNVWLVNGYEIRRTPYGDGIRINDFDGLTVAICLALAKKPSPLTGVEFRYIRGAGLMQSQAGLATLLGNNERAVEVVFHSRALGKALGCSTAVSNPPQ